MYTGGFRVRQVDSDGDRYLRLWGELDLATVPKLTAALAQDDSYHRLIVDTTDLHFIDSTGLGALVEARERLGAERFRLIPGPACLRVVQLTGLDDFFGLE